MVTDDTTVHENDQSNDERPLDEKVWTTLVDSIVEGTCTPFLGAGVAWPHLPTGKELAETLAKKYEYPLNDSTNLPRVAQYVATIFQDAPYAKRQVRDQIKARLEKFMESSDRGFPANYRLLAGLRLPIYLTTNYDDFLTRALKADGQTPREEVCRWNYLLQEEPDDHSDDEDDEPAAGEPLVFHLHGKLAESDSLLVTEDDYIDFTVSLARQGKDSIIPHWIRRALARTTLLFVGYSLVDWNFRVLMRQLMKQQNVQRSQQPLSVSIQVSDTDIPKERRLKAERFFADYLGNAAIHIHWEKASPFLQELDRRCRAAREQRRI